MASKVDELSGAPAGVGGMPVLTDELRAMVDIDLVDRAIENVTAGLKDDVRERLCAAWGRDDTSDVARMLQAARVSAARDRGFGAVGRRQVTVKYVLTAEQMRELIAAYPDYQLVPKPSIAADHGLGAQTRRLDDIDACADIPNGVRCADFGGNLDFHVAEGHVDMLTVRTDMDDIDPTRITQSDMKMERYASGELGISMAGREMARSVRAGDGKYLVRTSLQEFSLPMLAGKMTHVYDVPLADVAALMDRCGMQIFTVTLHIGGVMYEADSGELQTIGARFRVDRDKDTFSMGFVGSSAHWYHNPWSELMRYSADQVVAGSKNYYSYKIVRRRGDTIKAHVLPVSPIVVQEIRQVYRVPGIRAVIVDGWRLSTVDEARSVRRGFMGQSRRLQPESYVYPAGTWDRMVRAAAVEAAKGTLDYHKLVTTYTELVAGLSYNGQSVSENSVPLAELPRFLAMAGVYGYSEVVLMRRHLRHFVAGELTRRGESEEALVVQGWKGFTATVSAVLRGPWAWLADFLASLGSTDSKSRFKLVTAREAVRVQHVPLEVFYRWKRMAAAGEPAGEYVFTDHLLANVDAIATYEASCGETDTLLASDSGGDGQWSAGGDLGKPKAGGVEHSSGVTAGTVAVGAGRPPAWLPFSTKYGPHAEVYVVNDDWHDNVQRKAAIVDAAGAAAEEMNAVGVWMGSRFLELMAGGGEPNLARLRDKRADWYGPDLWRVQNGIVVESVLGSALDKFEFAGVYCPKARDYFNGRRMVRTHMYPVREVVSRWNGKAGKREERIYLGIGDETYNGYVMTCAKTVVYNGPEIERVLWVAAERDVEMDTGVREGGPGAGKTFLIRQNFGPKQFLTSPLKLSVEDMRRELTKAGKVDQFLVRKLVRTIDSVLVYVALHGLDAALAEFGRPEMLVCDEVYAAMPGRVYAVAHLFGVSTLLMYGDPLQIEAGVRATYVPLYKCVVAHHRVMSYVVYRSTPALLATYNEHYDNKLRTVNLAEPGDVKLLQGVKAVDCRADNVQLCMYQADKALVEKAKPERGKAVRTTHEAQGSTVDAVFLHDLDVKGGKPQTFNLHNNPRYVAVAFSRAKFQLVLNKTNLQKTLAAQWIRYAEDPRRVMACGDMSTVGVDFTTLPNFL